MQKDLAKFGIMFLLNCFLVGCFDETTIYAPVTEIATIQPIPKSGIHRVKTAETLYEIAWIYGLDYQVLARRNHIEPPYIITVGQSIYLTSPKNLVEPKPAAPIMLSQEKNDLAWIKPTEGKVIQAYSATDKGVDYSGYLGQPVVAASQGKVVYAGTGIRGYGKLIIIKHNELYLSAYAHNQTILVQEGEWVKQGQIIAKMGHSGTNKTMLHFEVRRLGKPINPQQLFN